MQSLTEAPEETQALIEAPEKMQVLTEVPEESQLTEKKNSSLIGLDLVCNLYLPTRFPKFLFSYNKHFNKLEQTLRARYALRVQSKRAGMEVKL